MNRRDDNVRIVYSTETGFVEPPRETKRPPKKKGPTVPDDGVIRVGREKRRASSITIVHGLEARELSEVAATLRKLCGTGGTAKNGVVELQGDHRDRVVAWFEEKGRRVKRAGG
ncbi:MAG: stress response translation initiation inhibitor YciH [Candidatus Eremiobacteraeota bacterium]|nr:stress response translation initiation inhibitor YciH [Candidatus Eremiobacteraeota bacterium]